MITTLFNSGASSRPAPTLEQWTCPPELAASSLPRPVRFGRTAKFIFALIGLWSCLTIGFAVSSLRDWRRDQTINQERVTASATVTGGVVTRGKGGLRQIVHYTYLVENRHYDGSGQVGWDPRSRVGATLRILYARSRPELSRPAETPAKSLLLEIMFCAFMFLIPLIHLYILTSQKRLLEWGKATGAIVTGKSNHGRGGPRLLFEFSDTAGNIVHGSQPYWGALLFTVVYNPARPSQYLVYPSQFVGIATSELRPASLSRKQ